MQVLMLEPDLDYLEDRRQRGAARRDEVWDGVLHLAPQPSVEHQLIETRLENALGPLVRGLGLEVAHGVTLFEDGRRDRNYRIPDVMVFQPARADADGTVFGVELVIEVLSRHDESRKKLPFYAAHAIPEVWLVDPTTRAVEVYVLRDGTYFGSLPDPDGVVFAPRFGLRLDRIDGALLRITVPDGSTVDV